MVAKGTRMPDAAMSFRGEGGWGCEMFATLQGRVGRMHSGIGWVIVGGESGPGFRAMDLGYARDVVDQCVAAEVPVFFKQTSGHRSGMPGPDDLDVFKQFPAEAMR